MCKICQDFLVSLFNFIKYAQNNNILEKIEKPTVETPKKKRTSRKKKNLNYFFR